MLALFRHCLSSLLGILVLRPCFLLRIGSEVYFLSLHEFIWIPAVILRQYREILLFFILKKLLILDLSILTNVTQEVVELTFIYHIFFWLGLLDLLKVLNIQGVGIEWHFLFLLVALLKPQNVDYPAIGANPLDSVPQRSNLSEIDICDKDSNLVVESLGELCPHEGDILIIGSGYDSSLVVHLDEDSLSQQDVAVIFRFQHLVEVFLTGGALGHDGRMR